jgi:hypothetical protein
MVVLNYYEQNLVKYLVTENLGKVLDYSFWLNHREYYLEMEGIAQTLGIDVKRIVVVNFSYELIAYCTSLLAKQMDGLLMHLRLYDFLAANTTKNITYIAEVSRGGKMLYRAVMNGGTNFFPTGMKDGAFSITLNQRNALNHSQPEFFVNLGLISMGVKQTVIKIREALESCDNYTCALNLLCNDQIVTGGYYILAGASGNDAVVITRNRTAPVNIT